MRGPSMKMLHERLEQIQSQIKNLQVQEALLLDLLREARGEPKIKPRAPRSNIKQTVLDYLSEVGDAGINATIMVEMASERGVKLERGSVSSILSRLKNDGVLTYDHERYRINPGGSQGNVHPLRTSGVFG